MSLREGYLKISRDPLGTFLWWRDLKLFLIKARPMVHARGPGKFVLVSNFCLKVLVRDANNLEKNITASICARIWAALPGA